MDTIRNRVGEVYEPFKVRFLEREIHALADDEVLVRVRASAICGSDLHIASAMPAATETTATVSISASPTATAMERWRIMWWQKLLMFMSCPNISLTRQGR